ncbi:glutaredoxin family protein [Thalassotalea sediminis]|uniref:glutaredoxin family protein n=1 Tax=Thalassotalea sediminis TaxID=1759089 RepID=UPI002573CB32|nr:glutaredoxin family protein [Thalassotalea sediminis]
MTIEYYLYSSEGCHLCEQALSMCLARIEEQALKVVDIVDDDRLVAEYGVHIPVLEHCKSGEKLFWPFTEQQINELVV